MPRAFRLCSAFNDLLKTFKLTDLKFKITLNDKGVLPSNTVAILSIGLLFVFTATGQILFSFPHLLSHTINILCVQKNAVFSTLTG